jgi:hypothetical protein
MFFAGGPKYQRVEGSMYNIFYIIGVTCRGSIYSRLFRVQVAPQTMFLYA